MPRTKYTGGIHHRRTSEITPAPVLAPAPANDRSRTTASSSNMNSRMSVTFLDTVEDHIESLQKRALKSRDEMHKLLQQLLVVEGNHISLEKELEITRAMITKERQKVDAHAEPMTASAPAEEQDISANALSQSGQALRGIRRSQRWVASDQGHQPATLGDGSDLDNSRAPLHSRSRIAESRGDPLSSLPRRQEDVTIGTPHTDRKNPTITQQNRDDNVLGAVDPVLQGSTARTLRRTSDDVQSALSFNHALRISLGSLPSPPQVDLPPRPVAFPQQFIRQRLGGSPHTFSSVSATKFASQVFRCTDMIKLNPDWHRMASRRTGCHTVLTLIDGMEGGDESKRYTLFLKAGPDGWMYSGEYQIAQRIIVPPEAWDNLDEDIRLVHVNKITGSSLGKLLLVEKGLASSRAEAATISPDVIMSFFARREEPCLRISYAILQCMSYNRSHYDLLVEAFNGERRPGRRHPSRSTIGPANKVVTVRDDSSHDETTHVPAGEGSRDERNLFGNLPTTPGGRRYVQQTIPGLLEGTNSPEQKMSRLQNPLKRRRDDDDDDDDDDINTDPFRSSPARKKSKTTNGPPPSINRSRREQRQVDYRLVKPEEDAMLEVTDEEETYEQYKARLAK